MDDRKIGTITRTLIWISIIIFILSWALNLFLRIIGASIGIICLISLSYIFYKERIRKQEMQSSIKTLKNAYNELDDQAKMMARTDLELNKTQEELDKKITGLYTLHEWGNTINQSYNVSDLTDSITKDFVEKLGFEKALIIFLNEQLKKLQLKKSINYPAKEISNIEKEINNNKIFPKILAKAESMLISNINKENKEQIKLSEISRLNSFVIAPISKQDTAIGIVIMGNNSPYNRVTEGDLELVSIFASQIGIAIQNSILYEEQWKSYQELENRIKQRTQELAKANEELKEMNKIKSDFVSSVTHELRTPLTSIKGFTNILIEGRLGEIPESQLERLKKIRKHSTSLAKLINNLLDISRIEAGRIEMEKDELRLQNIIDNVMEIIQPQAANKGIRIDQNINPKDIKIYADSNQIERVFMNLLGNAVKFTPKEGKITIEAKAPDKKTEISISDTGPGIPEEDLPHIFQEFYRANVETDYKQRGSGLGLSLVKRIIEAHNGNIEVNSSIGKGTTFIFSLPIKEQTKK